MSVRTAQPCLTNPSLADELRAATAAAHARIEANPRLARLLAEDLSSEEYAAILARLLGHHAPAEAAIAAWAAREAGALPATLDLPRRLDRTARLSADLAALGFSAARIAALPRAAIAPFTRAEEAWGMLYLLEGSALGGQVIARHRARRLGLSAATGAGALATPGAGRRWQGFRAHLAAAPLDAAALAEAANEDFARLDAWMAGPE